MCVDSLISRIYLRCTPRQKEALVRKAEKSRLSISRYVLALSENKKIYVVDGVPELCKQVIKIGTNVNQIAMVANSYKTVSAKQIEIVHSDLTKIQKLLTDLVNTIVNSKDEEIKV